MADIAQSSDPCVLTVRINLRWALPIATILPPIYLLYMIKYGSIRFPYWDDISIAVSILQYYAGSLTFDDLIAPINQARPLIPRLIFVGTAALTHWDIRVEHALTAVLFMGAWGALMATLRRISAGWPLPVALSSALLISIFACSPTGATNHTWSLMLIGSLAYFLSLAALLMVSTHPRSWPVNIAAAVLAWCAAYSMGQGLFLFPIMIALHQFISPRRWVPTPLVLFWLINMAACYALYLPGFTLEGDQRPTVFHFLMFIAQYIGNPLGEMLWFPRNGAVDLPSTLAINFLSGIAVLTLSAFAVIRCLRSSDRSPTILVFLSLTAFGMICAVVTAWGRATGPLAIEGANVSRYSVFSSCIVFGLIFYYGSMVARGEVILARFHQSAFVTFLLLAAISYNRGAAVYTITHNQNAWLMEAYAPEGAATDLDDRIFPNAALVRAIKADMYRFRIGPYR